MHLVMIVRVYLIPIGDVGGVTGTSGFLYNNYTSRERVDCQVGYGEDRIHYYGEDAPVSVLLDY